MKEEAEVIVLGAGIVGLCTALRLRLEGRDVLLVDRDTPGAAASFGNAGVFATYACIPLGTPAVLRSLPHLIFNPSSPLSIAPMCVPMLLPWLRRFARACFKDSATRSAMVLSQLLRTSLQTYEPLIDEAQAGSLIHRKGVLHLLRNKHDLDSIGWDSYLRTRCGVRQEILGPAGISSLEPALGLDYAYAIQYPDAAHVTDPFALTRQLAQAFENRGGRILTAEVTALEHTDRNVCVVAGKAQLCARTAVVALGVDSSQFARRLGDRIPLIAERGYHVEFASGAKMLSRPVCPLHLGFYLTPMQGRLRAAGTVELSSATRPINPRRLRLIERGARQLLPKLGTTQSRWLGLRPSVPDSMPVVGRSPRARNVIYAFGHGHLGLTLAGATAEIVADLIVRRSDTTELNAALSPARF